MKLTNKTQRLIKVGTVVVLPNATVEVNEPIEQYPVLIELARNGEILVEDTKTTKGTKNSTKKDAETGK